MAEFEEQIGPELSPRLIERLDEHIRRKYRIPAVPDRYRYIEMQQALLEFMDRDRGAAAEALLREIDEYLARTSEEYAERRTTDQREVIHSERGETERFRPLISADLYTEFKQFVDDLAPNITYTRAIEIALRERIEGGRKARVADRAASMLNALDPDGAGDRDLDLGLDHRDRLLEAADAADEDAPDFEHPPHTVKGKVERIRVSVADRLNVSVEDLDRDGGTLPKQHVIDAIDTHCTRGGRDAATDRTRAKYLELIEQDIGLVEHPSGVLYDLVDPAVLDQPAFEYKEDQQLSRQERAERVAVEALKRSRQQYGRSVGTDDIPRLFRGVEIEDAEVGKIRDRAGDLDGLAVREFQSGKRVVVDDIEAVDDALLRSAGMTDTDAEPNTAAADAAVEPDDPDPEPEPNPDPDDSADTGDDEAATGDAEDDTDREESPGSDSDRAEHEQEAADRLDELSRATIVTDGGW